MSRPSSPGIWFNCYEPDDTKYFQEQIPLTSERVDRFKSELIAAEYRDGHQRIALNRSAFGVRQLVTADTRVRARTFSNVGVVADGTGSCPGH